MDQLNNSFYNNKKLVGLLMQEQIDIISQTPDFGQCVLHWQDVTSVCLQQKCIKYLRQGYFCKECEPIHSKHKTQDIHQYAKLLSSKIISFQPSQKNNKISLQQTFSQLKQLSSKFQTNVQQITKLLASVNTRRIIFYEQVLKCTQKEMYDKLCQWGFAANGDSFRKICETLPSFKFEHPRAPQLYQAHSGKLKSRIEKFNESVNKLIEQAFSMKPVFEQIEKSTIQKQKPVSKVQLPVQTQINLSNKDLISTEVLDKIRQHYSINIKTINLEGNYFSSDHLKQVLELPLPNLTKLNVSRCFLDDESTTLLLETTSLPRLNYLNISENQFDNLNSQVIDKIRAKWPGINLIV